MRGRPSREAAAPVPAPPGPALDPATARRLDALIEGLSIRRALETEPHDRALTVEAIARITAPRPA